jgi:hypothetical protein
MYIAFGTLEEMADDMQKDHVQQVRVDRICLPGSPGSYGVQLDRFGVMVSARVGEEVRYAWIVTGGQQRLADTVMSGQDVPVRTETAHERIVAWLHEQGFETRHGSYSFPTNLRLMVAVAECTRQAE